MGRVLFAWELGAGYGHLRRLLPIADTLAAEGHAVGFAAVDAGRTRTLIAGRGYTLLQAPGPPVATQLRYVDSYATLLLNNGYDSPDELGRMLRGWLSVLDQFAPDLLVTDFAPTALLAARATGLPHATIGNGFTLPPARTPLPACRAWQPPPAARLEQAELAALATIAVACRGLSTGPPDSLAALFTGGPAFLCTFPELDHYTDRGPAEYQGPIYEVALGADPVWPGGPGPRLFGYVNAGRPDFRTAIAALALSGLPCLLHARDLPAERCREIEAAHPGLRISPEPVHLGRAMTEAAIVLCQGINTIAAALVAGRPVLVWPETLEQEMTAWQVVRRRLGATLPMGRGAEAAAWATRRLSDDDEIGRRVAALAQHYRGFTPDLSSGSVAGELAGALSPQNA